MLTAGRAGWIGGSWCGIRMRRTALFLLALPLPLRAGRSFSIQGKEEPRFGDSKATPGHEGAQVLGEPANTSTVLNRSAGLTQPTGRDDPMSTVILMRGFLRRSLRCCRTGAYVLRVFSMGRFHLRLRAL